MTFAGNIIQAGTGILWHCRISGLPYVFHSGETLPSAWLTGSSVSISGETYTPSATLIMRDGVRTKQQAMPKAGIATSTGMVLSFQLDATWLDISNTNLYRSGSARTSVLSAIDVDDTSLTVESITGWSAGDLVYSGLETMTAGTPAGSAIPVTRARYGSQARAIPVDVSSQSFGCYIADHPTTWHGRYVDLWMGTGRYAPDGRFVPNGSTIESSEDQLVFRGIVTGLTISRDLQRVDLELQSLDHLLSRTVGEVLPQATMGVPSGLHAFDDSCGLLDITVAVILSTGSYVEESASFRPFAYGRLYSLSDVSNIIRSKIYDITGIVSGTLKRDNPVRFVDAPDGSVEVQCDFNTTGNYASALAQNITIKSGEQSFMRALGFTGDVSLTVGKPIATVADITTVSQAADAHTREAIFLASCII